MGIPSISVSDVKDKIDNDNYIKTEQYMRNNRTIRLTEGRFREMVHRAVKHVLRENEEDYLNSDDRHWFLDSLYELLTEYYDRLGEQNLIEELEEVVARLKSGSFGEMHNA